MAMLAFQWTHVLISIWLYAGLLLTAVFLVLALVDWKQRNERVLETLSTDRGGGDRRNLGTGRDVESESNTSTEAE